MTELQNPFEFVGAQASPTEEAAAPMPPHIPEGAAADLPDFGTDCIGEIFVGARKLGYVTEDFDPAAYPLDDQLLYDVLSAMADPLEPGLSHIPDEQALFDAIEPPPLFLQERVA